MIRSKKAVLQVTLLACGAAMLGYLPLSCWYAVLSPATMPEKTRQTTGTEKKEIASLMAMEPKSMEEATKLHQDLMAQETAILSDNNALWEKVFLSANKD